MDGTELLGLLNVYHDAPHAWTDDELETIAALATQASVAIRTAQNFQQMATWTAQLQSIQQLGARLEPPLERRARSAWPSRPSCASSSTTTTSACTGSTATT